MNIKKALNKLGLCVLMMSMSSAYATGFSIFAQELFWHASEQTAGIWSNEIPLSSFFAPDQFAYSPQEINFNWSRGFRGGVHYVTENDVWDTAFVWTYFPAESSPSHNTGAQIIIPNFFSGYVSGNYFFGASLDWLLNMNMFDVSVSHPFKILPSVILQPAIGIKAGTIDQTIHATWNAIDYVAKENLIHNYSGIGPSLGVGAKWNIYEQFNLLANLSGAFLWGSWNVRDTYNRPSAFLVAPTTISTTMNQSYLGTMMLDYLFGVEWRYQGRSQVAIQLGYEMQYWLNQLRVVSFQQNPTHGDLTIQGATCGMTIDL